MEEYKIKNYVEIAVSEVLNELAPKFPELCKCEKCLKDVMAIALNNLPPNYVVTVEGEIFRKVNFDLIGGKTHIITSVLNAINLVSSNPKH